MTKDDRNHVHDENCGCGHDEEQQLMILVDEEGIEHSFVLIDMLEVDDQSYALLAPAEPNADEDEDEETVYICRVVSDEDGELQLVSVDDDDEFDRVVAAWDELEDNWDEDELDSDSDDDD